MDANGANALHYGGNAPVGCGLGELAETSMVVDEKIHRWMGVGVFLLTLRRLHQDYGAGRIFLGLRRIYRHLVYPRRAAPARIAALRPARTRLLARPTGRRGRARHLYVGTLVGAGRLVRLPVYARAGTPRAGRTLLQPFRDSRDIGILAGAVLASLLLAFSYTQWFNATEAEVYGYSIFFTCFGLWLILYWEGTGHGMQNDRWLLFIAYLFGLGGGLHLLCLLTIPTLAILVWFADEKLRRLIVLLIGFAVFAILDIALLGSGTASKLVLLAGLAGLLYHLYQTDRRLLFAGGRGRALCAGLFDLFGALHSLGPQPGH